MTNLVFVILDDLGAELWPLLGRGGSGVYGYANSAWLTALAQGGTVQGVVYSGGVSCTRAYVEQLCSPTRASHQTGRHPFRTGVGDIIRNDSDGVTTQAALPESEITLAKLLKGAGYATGVFGKWHLGNTNVGGRLSPNRAGFDMACTNLFNTDNSVLVTVSGTTYRNGFYAVDETIQGEAKASRPYWATTCVNRALRWIRDVVADGDPFYCYLPLYSVHAPFTNRNTGVPFSTIPAINTPPTTLYDAATWTLAADLDQTTTAQQMHAYRAGIEAAMTELGRFFASLPSGVLADTLIVFTTDNGSPSSTLANEVHPTLGAYPSTHGKDTPYEPGICVPLVFAGAGVVAPGRTYDELVSAVDVYATCAEMLGVDLPEDVTLDSVSLAPVLDNTAPTDPVRTYSYSEWFQPNGPNTSDAVRTAGEWSIQDGTYKLIKPGLASPYEFYVVGPTASYSPMESTNLTPAGITSGLTAPQLAAFNALVAARAALLVS